MKIKIWLLNAIKIMPGVNFRCKNENIAVSHLNRNLFKRFFIIKNTKFTNREREIFKTDYSHFLDLPQNPTPNQ